MKSFMGLDADAIKDILMMTARDEGPTGEDNAYGWGTIDAYEAVARATASVAPPRDVTGQNRLLASRPNPFTHETTLVFRISSSGPITLAIHDPGGRLVRRILSGSLSAGEHTAIWDGRDESGRPVRAGVYFSALKVKGSVERRKMLLLQ